MASSIIKTLKNTFTPHIARSVHQQGVLLTILWVSGLLVTLGLSLAMFTMYNRLLVLEQVVTVLGAR